MISKRDAKLVAYGQICDLIEAQILYGWCDDYLLDGAFSEDRDDIGVIMEQASKILAGLERKAKILNAKRKVKQNDI